MRLKKFSIKLLLLLFCTSFVFSQNLVELAKKEKERRDKLKKKTTVVVTSADLKKVKKEPAVVIKKNENAQEEVPTPSPNPPKKTVPLGIIEGKEPKGLPKREELENKWKKAQEEIGLLTLKMNAFWYEYYTMPRMTPRNHIQQQISHVYLELQKTKQEEIKLKQELEALRKKKRTSSTINENK